MKTMQQEWQEYRDRVYPKDMPTQQAVELHQTFFAGALTALQKLLHVSNQPEKSAFKAVGEIEREIMEVCTTRADTIKARN